jgi:8-oxo-dGTP diphosphatase
MAVKERWAARALVLSRTRRVLLMRYRFPWNDFDLWITPGGGIERGEAPRKAALRELLEETGLELAEIGPEIWNRDHQFPINGREWLLRERYFLAEVEEFEPLPFAFQPGGETEWFREFRWWPLDEIPDVSGDFAPNRMGELVRALLRDGAPPQPLVIGV